MQPRLTNSFKAALRRQIGLWGVFCILFSQIGSSPGVLEWGFNVSDLVSHYKVHRKMETNLSFMDFLAVHYGDQRQDHEEEHDHSQLPFKGEHQQHILSFAFPLIPGEFNVFELRPPTAGSGDLISKIPAFLTIEAIVSLWQPPRPA